MRRRRCNERGQAALLGVIGVVVIAIGMYTSYNLSRAVYEKIQLQNAADATAYSLATLEARSFNFIAFANRAQVANYVQMLELQSLLSSATYAEGSVAMLGETAKMVAFVLRFINPGMARAFDQIGDSFRDVYRNILKPTVDGLDRLVPMQMTALTTKNVALTGVASMLFLSTATQIAAGGMDIARANDPDARANALSLAFSVWNGLSYANAFDFDSVFGGQGVSPDDRARRLMTEVVNASRWGSGEPSFIVARGMAAAATQAASGLAGARNRGGRTRGAGSFFSFMDNLTSGLFVGTSKMLSGDGQGLANLDDTARRQFDASWLALGDAIAAKDRSRFSGKLASVISTPEKGEHCRYEDPGSAFGRITRIGTLVSGRAVRCDKEDDNRNHVWRGGLRGGIQPFMSFAPDGSVLRPQRGSFNQPDVWIWLTKRPRDMRMGNRDDLDFTLRAGRQSADLDARIGEQGVAGLGIGEGMHALARAQVYYHRPGAWNEPPNFFNPFWGARLAPKSELLDRALGQMGLPSTIASFISDNVWMH